MPRTGWKMRSLALLILVGTVAPARSAEPGQTQWKLANFTWVKRVPAEPGAPANAHPVLLTDATLLAALGSVQVAGEDKAALFAKDELAGLSKALREALSLAQPGEDLILLSTNKRGGRFMEEPLALTARIFVRDGALNLLVHDARLAFMGRYNAENILPGFVYGSRQAPSAVSLQAPGATPLRGDWLALPLGANPVVAPPPAAAPAMATSPVAASAATPKAAPEPSTGPRDAAFYEAQTQRLKALKRLRDENLLSEAEYQDKREAILKTL